MKNQKYYCPVHLESLLHEEDVPESLTERIQARGSSLLAGAFISEAFWVDVGGGSTDDKGPYECKQCKKYYHKWECVQK